MTLTGESWSTGTGRETPYQWHFVYHKPLIDWHGT